MKIAEREKAYELGPFNIFKLIFQFLYLVTFVAQKFSLYNKIKYTYVNDLNNSDISSARSAIAIFEFKEEE